MHCDWQELTSKITVCTACKLAGGRTMAVPGEGNPHASVLLVGEGPGREEDRTGRPFVGAAGQLLDRMLAAIDLSREEVFIANVVKCRPPDNRVPEEAEAEACLPYLRAQFALIRPKIIVCLGATAARYVMGRDMRITRDRGVWRERKGVAMMATYHPAALLRDPAKKREAWQDLLSLRKKLDELAAKG